MNHARRRQNLKMYRAAKDWALCLLVMCLIFGLYFAFMAITE